MRPLQGASAGRGIGSYARGLLAGMVEAGFDSQLTLLLDVAFDEPALPAGRFRLAGCRRRYHGQLSAYEDAVVLGRDVERIGADVYHAVDLRLPGRPPCPLVVTVHDLIPWAWGGPAMRGERLRYWLGRRLLRAADAVVAVSRATAIDAERLAGVSQGRIRVVPEAAGAAFRRREDAGPRVRRRWPIDGEYLLFVGALDARKGLPELLDAYAALPGPLQREHLLVLVGPKGTASHDLGPRLRAPREGRVVQLGYMPDVDLPALYRGAAALVLPSRYEGFGLPVLEAMACGVPVVASDDPALVEVAGGCARHAPRGDAPALTGQIVKALTSTTTRNELIEKGLVRASKMTWEASALVHVQAYLGALDVEAAAEAAR